MGLFGRKDKVNEDRNSGVVISFYMSHKGVCITMTSKRAKALLAAME